MPVLSAPDRPPSMQRDHVDELLQEDSGEKGGTPARFALNMSATWGQPMLAMRRPAQLNQKTRYLVSAGSAGLVTRGRSGVRPGTFDPTSAAFDPSWAARRAGLESASTLSMASLHPQASRSLSLSTVESEGDLPPSRGGRKKSPSIIGLSLDAPGSAPPSRGGEQGIVSRPTTPAWLHPVASASIKARASDRKGFSRALHTGS
eukprot:CAMPEP_0180165068 /NCGR_PEP_ID=MMETSP0986-20121125/30759_1 /TAXON_ID=697907 /ORGANISM="non described non described, Strain CCMP2293" /LENGTH=203 /DNA_ID=CAMNT_0022115993 /DNA_START=57 /DNA_END=665 /DNA_ORIENTATION=+